VSVKQIAVIRRNVGLGEAAKLPAITALISANGWVTIPTANNQKLIVQWGSALSGNSNSIGLGVNFPIPFPNTVLVITMGNIDPTFQTNSFAEFVGFANATRLGFIAKSKAASNDTFQFIAIGY
jgi:hypothetical protein